MYHVGIDLGTTNSCVATLGRAGGTFQVEVLPDRDLNRRTVPSVVGFSETGEMRVGHPALAQQLHRPESTIYAVKRMIGLGFYDTQLQKDIKTWLFEVVNDNGNPKIKAYEGERTKIEDNYKLGGFFLKGIPPMPAGHAKVEVKFKIDKNGILNMTAWETTTGSSCSIVLTSNRSHPDDPHIQRMVEKAAEWTEQDDYIRRRVLARNSLDKKLLELKRIKPSRDVMRKCDEIERWADENTNATDLQLIAKEEELDAYARVRY